MFSGPLGRQTKFDDFRADIGQETMALSVLSPDKRYLYTHPNLKRRCISLGFKHCNRYKAKIKTCCKVLNLLLWNDPRLDFLEVSGEKMFKFAAYQWN